MIKNRFNFINFVFSGTYVKVNNTGYGNGEYSGVVGKAIQPDPPLAALIVSFAGYPSALADKPNYNIIGE